MAVEVEVFGGSVRREDGMGPCGVGGGAGVELRVMSGSSSEPDQHRMDILVSPSSPVRENYKIEIFGKYFLFVKLLKSKSIGTNRRGKYFPKQRCRTGPKMTNINEDLHNTSPPPPSPANVTSSYSIKSTIPCIIIQNLVSC